MARLRRLEMMYDVVVIGGGPAGIAAAISANNEGAKVMLIEREDRLGGILKQCIHDGFGLIHFKERLSGTEYSERFIDKLLETDVDIWLMTFVVKIIKSQDGFTLHIVNRNGLMKVNTKAIVLATGCRERTAKQVFIHGTRPSGIFTAGTAQSYVNIQGHLPTKRCIILGSGDIGLIMARRLTLEGAKVIGVYEIKPTPSGLIRNIHQCLNDFDIPLHLSHTVTRVFGMDRLNAVEIAQVDNNMQPIHGTEQIIECDSLILSVGLIPENELAESLDVIIHPKTCGPICDQAFMTNIEGIYCAGNALHVSDLVDYVTENAYIAGKNAIRKTRLNGIQGRNIPLDMNDSIMYVVPTHLNIGIDTSGTIIYFRSSKDMVNARLTLTIDNQIVLEKRYDILRPPEMQRLRVDFSRYNLSHNSTIRLALLEGSE